MVKEIRTTNDVRKLVDELGLTVVKGCSLRAGADAYMVGENVIVDVSKKAEPFDVVKAIMQCLNEEGYVKTKKIGKTIIVEVWERR